MEAVFFGQQVVIVGRVMGGEAKDVEEARRVSDVVGGGLGAVLEGRVIGR